MFAGLSLDSVGADFTHLHCDSPATPATTANFSIAFRDNSGAPAPLAVNGGASAGTLSDTVPAHGLRYYEASSTSGQTLSGSGVITADPGIAIQALFRNHAADDNYYEASLPTGAGVTEFEIPFDGTTFAPTASPTYTGIAIANDTGASVTVSCTARDQSGSAIANAITVPALTPAGHWRITSSRHSAEIRARSTAAPAPP